MAFSCPLAGAGHAREVEVREVDTGIMQALALLGDVGCRMPLLHERERRIITALGANAQIVDAVRGKQPEVFVALVLDIGDAAKATEARDARELLLDEFEDGHETLRRKRIWIATREVNAMLVGTYGLRELVEVLLDLLDGRHLELDVAKDTAEMAFVMRAARDDLQHGTVHDGRRLVLWLGDVHDLSQRKDVSGYASA